MIRFAHPGYVYLLALLPVLIAGFWLIVRARRKAIQRFGNETIISRLAESASKRKRMLKFSILIIALAFLILGLANPQIGTRLEEVKQEGIDIFVALDVSLSMKAEDIKPNRLEKAKLEIRNLIDRLGGDRIGLVVFAGEAYTQFPLTTDYSAANLFLDAVDVDVVPVPGTAISAAIKRAMESFDFKDPTTKVIIIVTDGENTEGDAIDAATDASNKGVLLYTIGMGSPAGTPIPIYNAAGQQTDFKRDRDGNIVVTKLDETSLEKIASIGNGKYFRGTNAQDELNEIYKNINTLKKHEFGVKQFTDYEDRFQFFIGVGIFLLILEFFITEKKVQWLARWNPLRKEEEIVVMTKHHSILIVILGLMFAAILGLSSACGQSVRSLVGDGNSLYKDQKYADAEVSYRKALEKNQDLVPGHFNLGNALYKQDKADEAIKEYENALAKAASQQTKAEAYYNLGNAYMKGQRYQDAAKSYIESLKLRPDDQDTKYNLSYALEKMRQQQQQQKQDQNDKSKDSKQDEQKRQSKDRQKQDQRKQNEQQQRQKDQQTQQQKQQQGQEKKMAKADAERILDVLKNSEKEVQKKLRARPAVRAKTDKDW